MQGSQVHIPRALPARSVPPSGFGYPLDGLLPASPGRLFFTPAALMGFTLRSVLHPQGTRCVSARMHPHTVMLVVIRTAEAVGRPGEHRFLGFDPCGSTWRPNARLTPRPLGAPLGFTLLGSTGDRLGRDFARPPPSRFAHRGRSHDDRRPGVSFDDHLAPASCGEPQTTGTTLLGLLHQHIPWHSGRIPIGLLLHLTPRRTLLPANRRALIGDSRPT
jgi:hypothetical protein